jgi:hypothetical protein
MLNSFVRTMLLDKEDWYMWQYLQAGQDEQSDGSMPNEECAAQLAAHLPSSGPTHLNTLTSEWMCDSEVK